MNLYNSNHSFPELNKHYDAIKHVPRYTREEEFALAHKMINENDAKSEELLILSHCRFVLSIARTYSGYGLSIDDIVQEGTIGLVKAVKRFQPELGNRLSSFAIHWIKAEINGFVMKNWKMVNVATTKSLRKLFFNLRKHTNGERWLNDSEVTSIAETLEVPKEDVTTMEERLYSGCLSLSDFEDDEQKISSESLITALTDPKSNFFDRLGQYEEYSERSQMLHAAIGQLDDRRKEILFSRVLTDDKLSLESLATRFSVSAERIRQLESDAVVRVKNIVLNSQVAA